MLLLLLVGVFSQARGDGPMFDSYDHMFDAPVFQKRKLPFVGMHLPPPPPPLNFERERRPRFIPHPPPPPPPPACMFSDKIRNPSKKPAIPPVGPPPPPPPPPCLIVLDDQKAPEKPITPPAGPPPPPPPPPPSCFINMEDESSSEKPIRPVILPPIIPPPPPPPPLPPGATIEDMCREANCSSSEIFIAAEYPLGEYCAPLCSYDPCSDQGELCLHSFEIDQCSVLLDEMDDNYSRVCLPIPIVDPGSYTQELSASINNFTIQLSFVLSPPEITPSLEEMQKIFEEKLDDAMTGLPLAQMMMKLEIKMDAYSSMNNTIRARRKRAVEDELIQMSALLTLNLTGSEYVDSNATVITEELELTLDALMKILRQNLPFEILNTDVFIPELDSDLDIVTEEPGVLETTTTTSTTTIATTTPTKTDITTGDTSNSTTTISVTTITITTTPSTTTTTTAPTTTSKSTTASSSAETTSELTTSNEILNTTSSRTTTTTTTTEIPISSVETTTAVIISTTTNSTSYETGTTASTLSPTTANPDTTTAESIKTTTKTTTQTTTKTRTQTTSSSTSTSISTTTASKTLTASTSTTSEAPPGESVVTVGINVTIGISIQYEEAYEDITSEESVELWAVLEISILAGLKTDIPGLTDLILLAFVQVQQNRNGPFSNGIVKRQSTSGKDVLGVLFEMQIEQDPSEANNQLFENPAAKLQEILDEGGTQRISEELKKQNVTYTIDENVAVEAVLSRMSSSDPSSIYSLQCKGRMTMECGTSEVYVVTEDIKAFISEESEVNVSSKIFDYECTDVCDLTDCEARCSSQRKTIEEICNLNLVKSYYEGDQTDLNTAKVFYDYGCKGPFEPWKIVLIVVFVLLGLVLLTMTIYWYKSRKFCFSRNIRVSRPLSRFSQASNAMTPPSSATSSPGSYKRRIDDFSS